MKLSTKKLFLISLIVGTSFSNCKATSPNNNTNREGVAPTVELLIQSLKEANEKALQKEKKRTKQMLQAQNQMFQKQSQMFQVQQKQYKRKNKKRRKKRNKQRQKYVAEKSDRQEEEYSKAEYEHKKEIYAGVASVLGVFISGIFCYFSHKDVDPTAYAELAGTGVKVVFGVMTKDKKVPGNRKTAKELQQEAKELWPSSSDEDDSEDESNNNNFNIKKIRKYSEDDSKDTNNNNRA